MRKTLWIHFRVFNGSIKTVDYIFFGWNRKRSTRRWELSHFFGNFHFFHFLRDFFRSSTIIYSHTFPSNPCFLIPFEPSIIFIIIFLYTPNILLEILFLIISGRFLSIVFVIEFNSVYFLFELSFQARPFMHYLAHVVFWFTISFFCNLICHSVYSFNCGFKHFLKFIYNLFHSYFNSFYKLFPTLISSYFRESPSVLNISEFDLKYFS